MILGSAGRRPMFESTRVKDATVIHVDDEIDISSAHLLATAIERAEAAPGRVVVSLEACKYCDSTGLRTLIGAWKRMQDRLGVVVPPTGNCRRIFEVTGISGLEFVFGSLDEALAR